MLKRFTGYKRLLALAALSGGAAPVERTATGNPLTFETDLAKPLKSLIAKFLPVQDAGTPSPDNILPITGWTGVNIEHFDENLLTINRTSAQTNQGITYTPIKQDNKTVAVHVTGQRTNNNPFFNLDYVNGTTNAIPPGTYKIFGGTAEVRFQVFYKDSGGNEQVAGYEDGSGATVTIPSDATASWCRLLVFVNTPVDTVIYPIIMSTDSVITRYPVTFPALGKNLSKFVNGKGIATDGTIGDSASRTATVEPIPIESGISYIFTFETGYDGIYSVFNDNTLIRRAGASNGDTLDTSNGNKLYVCVYKSGDTATWESAKPMVRKSTESAGYAPYMNTVYGGYVDIVTGQLWATWNGIKKKWSEGASPTDMGSGITRKAFPMVDNLTTGSANNLCNVAPYKSNEEAEIHFYYSGSGATNRNARVFLPTETDGDTEILIITKVSVPILLATLSPTQINALIGGNTVWSDGNGDCEVTFLKKG